MFNLERLGYDICFSFYMRTVMFALFLGMRGEFDYLLVKHIVKSKNIGQKYLLIFLRDFVGFQLAYTTMALGQQIMLFSLYVHELF